MPTLTKIVTWAPETADAHLILTEFRKFRDDEWKDFRTQVMEMQRDALNRIAFLEWQIASGVGAGFIAELKPLQQMERMAILEAETNQLLNWRARIEEGRDYLRRCAEPLLEVMRPGAARIADWARRMRCQ